jgi:hypothetical protein
MLARNSNEAEVASMVWSGGVDLARVWSQAVRFVLVRLTGIWL